MPPTDDRRSFDDSARREKWGRLWARLLAPPVPHRPNTGGSDSPSAGATAPAAPADERDRESRGEG